MRVNVFCRADSRPSCRSAGGTPFVHWLLCGILARVSDPRAIYESRLANHRAEAAALRARERAMSIARIVLFLAAVVIAIIHFSAWIVIPILGFVALVVGHDRTITRRRRADAAARFCERGIERLTGQWQGKGIDGSVFVDDHHPFAADLDLFGKGSLYELLCVAATSAGRATLAKWLLNPGDVTAAEVRERQVAVDELRDRVELREEIAVAAAEVAHDVEEAKLDDWSRGEAVRVGRGERIAAIAITALTAIALALGIPSLVSRFVNATNPGAMPQVSPLLSLPLLVMIVVVALFARGLSSRVARVVGAVERREPALALLAGLLAVLERQSFAAPRLVALRGVSNGTASPHRARSSACASSWRCSTRGATSSLRRSRCCFSGRRTSHSPSSAGAPSRAPRSCVDLNDC